MTGRDYDLKLCDFGVSETLQKDSNHPKPCSLPFSRLDKLEPFTRVQLLPLVPRYAPLLQPRGTQRLAVQLED